MNQEAGSGFFGFFCLGLVEGILGFKILGGDDRHFFRHLGDGFNDGFDGRLGGDCDNCDNCGNCWRGGGEDNAGRLGAVALFHVFALVLALGLGAGNGHIAAHEWLVVKDFHGTHGFIHPEHFHKAVALGAVSAAVVNDLDIAHSADAFEKFLEVLLGHVVGQVPDVDAGGLDACRIAAAWTVAVTISTAWGTFLALAFGALFAGWARFTRFAGFTRRASFTFTGTGVAGVGLGRAVSAWKRGGLGLAVISLAALRPLRAGGWRRSFRAEADGFEDFLPEAQLDRRISAGGAWGLWAEFFGAIAMVAASRLATVVAITAFAAVTATVATAFVVVLVAVLASAVAAATVVSRVAGIVCCV